MRSITTFIATCLVGISSLMAQQWGLYTLIAPQSKTAYLIDTNGTKGHTWTFTDYSTGYSAYLLPGGTIVRSISTGTGGGGGGSTGGVQKVDWNGNILWTYLCSGMHHDICPMPNGNVLLIVWESKTASQVSAVGCSTSKTLSSEKIIEVNPATNKVVWVWHAWDHLCQSVNSSITSTYVSSVSAHPELLNINYNVSNTDFLHMNGIDYNEYRDQIIISSHYWNEMYVIDHSTDSTQAASHTGGNSGKGGDFLYRWGNPAAYGASGTTNFSVIHDAHWVPQNVKTFANYIGGFNNQGAGKSAADMVNPPYSGDYNFTWGTSGLYTPSTYGWRYVSNYTASNMGSQEQLPNGNTMICVPNGAIVEVNSSGTPLWTYTSAAPPQAHRYSECYVAGTQPTKPTITASGNTLTCSTTGTSYQWFLNAYMISGATSQTYTATQSGTYQVQVVNANFCYSDISAKYVHTYSSGTILPASITVTASSSSVVVGSTPTVTATVLPSGAANKSVTWSSSNTAIATVDANGNVTTIGVGTVTITATSVAATSVTGSATITITPILVTSVVVSPSTSALVVGQTAQLSATVSPSNATTTTYTWSSSNTAIATVSSTGLVTAVSVGTANIIAAANDGSGVTGSCAVTVTAKTYTQNITLVAGWNLISFYVTPTSNTVSSIFGANISYATEIKTMDAFWSASNIAAYNSLTTMATGAGYLVYCTSGFTLSVSGTYTAASFQSTFATGWNLVGVPVSSSLAISSTISTTAVNTIKDFNGFWKPGGSTNSLSSLDPGKAYFIKGN